MMRKRIAIILIAVFMGMFIFGCGRKDAGQNAQNPIPIVVWHYYNGQQKDAFDRLVKEFNNTIGADKGIVVTAESKGEVNALSEAVQAAARKDIGAEEMPDIFAAYVDTANTIYQMGMLTDISQYMTEEELEEYVPSFLTEGRLAEGELQVFPVAKSTELLYLNKTEWDKFAGDTGHVLDELLTWEGLAEVAEDYYQWSNGKAFFGRDAEANFMYVGCHQLGTDIYQEQNGQYTVQLDETSMRKIWDSYAVPYIKGYYGSYGRFRSDDVKTGDLVACVGSTSSAAYFPTEVTMGDGSAYPIEGIVLPLPNFQGTTACAVQQGAGMAVTKSEEYKEAAAVEFLKWFTDIEQNVEFCAESGYFPVKMGENMTDLLEELLQSQGYDEEELICQNTLLGAATIQQGELYTPPVIEGGAGYRSSITTSMTEWLKEYKEAYSALETEEQEQFLEQCYRTWLDGLKQEIQ